MTVMPFLTTYDPPGTSEGTLDPLGLYQIADQLAVQLIPAVRERMQRIRFLTAMAVGAIVTENLENDSRYRDASPQLVWEWLIVEALIREMADDATVWGVPGTLVTKRALAEHGYLDARSYLKTPAIFGIHGVYKRLATRLGLVDIHLGLGPNTEGLVDAWARDCGLGGLSGAKDVLSRWSDAVARSLEETPPRTNAKWSKGAWNELAQAFAPGGCKSREKRFLRELLHVSDERRLGALPTLWSLQSEFADSDDYREEQLHDRLEQEDAAYGPLLAAIRAYEAFARSLQDAFDVLKFEAARHDAQGFPVSEIARNADFQRSVSGLHDKFYGAEQSLHEVTIASISLQNLFAQRFAPFALPQDAGACALAICAHHEVIQRNKSADGKRPWFDRVGPDRIYVRHAYREPGREIEPGRYLHDYRGWPIRRFHIDLT